MEQEIHARLRRETASLHQEVERALPLVSPELTLERYRQVLERFYGFYAPHEERMATFAPAPAVPPCPRAPLLAQDLVTLGLSAEDIERLPRCAVPPVTRIEQLAGCLYVFEGASLGGQVVARALQKNLGIGATSGAAFFAGSGEDTVPRWRQVLSWLGEISNRHGDPGAISASARETFLRLRDWLEQRDGA